MSTISMSAVWVKVSTILCLCYTAEMKGVQWREVGQYITIQCRSSSDQDNLILKTGLNETEIFVLNKDPFKETIGDKIKGRVQTAGTFPNIDILIKNLRENDTGPYWCTYSKTEDVTYQQKIMKDDGSVLLVVTEKRQETPPPSNDPLKKCEEADMNMVLLGIAIAFGVLFIMMLGFVLIIMHKTKSSNKAIKQRRVAAGNDVYEDMRGTLRR
ncbi:PREDICTED: uncharacterized protein LOC106910606 [Poecilia mexicana]|uniref:uncharacterized protein LOC106910606 n=1 Tax=Poecilia mexicana TaxID=48701 RepID=UPI00072DBC7F|nr:PREDICTED: uncharacterized protein LOC106910606 [Poecilia mexicana]